MAVPSYTTDLLTVDLADNTTGWAELAGHTSGGSATSETDYFIHNVSCVSQSTGTKTGTVCGLQYDNGGTITLATDDVFLFWQLYLAANAQDVFANGGMRVGVGSTSGNMNFWKSGGSDFARNPYGGWHNVAVDPTFTADYTDGTPVAATYQFFGVLPNLVAAVSKGNPHGVDAIRWGRAEFIVTGGETADFATAAGMAAINDLNITTFNRWGLFQEQAGQFLWKGLWSLGTTATLVDFRDSNRAIVVDDTPRTYAAFNKIEISNASSRVDWTGFTFSTLGTLARGNFECIDNADVNMDTCVFNDMGTFIFQSVSTMINCTFRRCDLITQAGSTFTDCVIDSSFNTTHAMIVTNPTTITGCNFISDGTGHAVRCDTIGTYSWTNNTDTGYTGARGSNLIESTGSADAMFYNNSGGLITLNVGGATGQSPSVRNGAGATTSVVNSVTLSLSGIETDSEVRIINLDDVENFNKELAGSEQISGSVTKAILADGGSGYTNGTQTLTVVGGTGTAAQVEVTVAGNVVTSIDSITVPGSYTANPPTPATTSGGGGTGATLRLTIAGTFDYAYDAGLGINVAIIVFHLNFRDVRIEQVLPATDSSIPIQQTTDRTYNNP